MKRLPLSAIVLTWALLGVVLAAAQPTPRVAVLDFAWAHAPYSRDPALADFSRAVQARLHADDQIAWVERQEMDRIVAEVDLGGVNGGSAATAVRLGHWLRADLLLRGDIVAPAAGTGVLRLEVIELGRAELLVTKTVPVELGRGRRLHPDTAMIQAAAEAARSALADARQRLSQFSSERVVAPLYFKTADASDRLEFITQRLLDTLQSTATTRGGCRLLNFPRAGEAGEEASLVLGGLTDTAPEAAEKVADAYVWGTFVEKGGDGLPFADVPIVITLQVWTGNGVLQDVTWEGTVRTLDAGLKEVAEGVVALALTEPPRAAGAPVRRTEVARNLMTRDAEIRSRIARLSEAAVGSPEGRRLAEYRVRGLEAACFFDPLNRELQERRIEATWRSRHLEGADASLRNVWLEVMDLALMVRRFGRQADGTRDGTWERHQTAALAQLIPKVKVMPWRSNEPAKLSAQEAHEQLRTAIRAWARVVADAGAHVSGTPEPAWFPDARRRWLDEMQTILREVDDPIIRREMIAMVWPVVAQQVGDRLKAAQGRPRDGIFILTNAVITTYDRFGDFAGAQALLKTAWAAGRAAPARPATSTASPAPAAVASVARRDEPWAKRTDWRPPGSGLPAIFRPDAPAANDDGRIPSLPARVQDVDLRPIVLYQRTRDPASPLWRRATSARVRALGWDGERLWAAEQSRTPLPPEIASPQPKGAGDLVWIYDPARQTRELATARLGAHSPIRSLTAHEGRTWLGFEADGVWELDGAAEKIRRFKGEDGLQSSEVHAGLRHGNELFFLVGKLPDYFINRYSLTDGTWTGMRVPISPHMAMLAQRTAGRTPERDTSPTLAVCGDWLAVVAESTAFYDLAAGAWVDLAARRDPADPRPDSQNRRSFDGAHIASADDQAFWLPLGTMNGGLTVLDPNEPWKASGVPVPGLIKAVAHHGPWLWVLTGDRRTGSQLLLLDKRTRAWAGKIELPGTLMDCLAVADDRVWLGGASTDFTRTAQDGLPTLLEVHLETPRPASDRSLLADARGSLHRLAWQGDAANLRAALAAKTNPNQASPSGWTPLMTAINAGHGHLVEPLLAAGANPNALADDGTTALGLATRRQDVALVELLLRHGADPIVHTRRRFHDIAKSPTFVYQREATEAPTRFSTQPTAVRASTTADGEVQLTWEDRADDEAFYEVRVRSKEGFVIGGVDLPPDTTSWVDHADRNNAELSYTVAAVNGHIETVRRDFLLEDMSHPPLSPVTIARPARAPHVHPLRLGVRPGGPAQLETAVVTPTPLIAAATAGREDLVQLLLAHKADPNQTDACGETPLLAALRGRHYGVARLLLAAGANGAASGPSGETPAALVYHWHEDRALLEQLLAGLPAGQSRLAATALIALAARRGQIADIVWLRGRGGDLGERVLRGQVAMAEALNAKQRETAAWIWDHAEHLQSRWKNRQEVGTDPELARALMRSGDADLVARMLEVGVPADLKISHRALVSYAAEAKALSILDLLWARKVDFAEKDPQGKSAYDRLTPEEAGRYGRTPREQAEPEGWPLPGAYKVLLCGPPNYVFQEDPAKAGENRALLAACARGDLSAVIAAVGAGAQLECRSPEGLTPLLSAIKANSFPVARWLVEEGAQLYNLSQRGQSPVAFATRPETKDILACLLAAGADCNRAGDRAPTPLAFAILQPEAGLVETLLDAGADPNLVFTEQTSGRKLTPLALAAWRGRADLVELLLARGANPLGQPKRFIGEQNKIRAENDPSILMYAVAGKQLGLVRKFVELGQDPRQRTHDGADALSWSADEGQVEIFKYLLPLSERRGLALERATARGHQEIRTMLEQVGYGPP